MQNQKLFVLGNPTDRCSFVWFGEPISQTDKWYSSFSLFKEYEIESIHENTDGTFDIKPKNINFIYRHIKPAKTK